MREPFDQMMRPLIGEILTNGYILFLPKTYMNIREIKALFC